MTEIATEIATEMTEIMTEFDRGLELDVIGILAGTDKGILLATFVFVGLSSPYDPRYASSEINKLM